MPREKSVWEVVAELESLASKDQPLASTDWLGSNWNHWRCSISALRDGEAGRGIPETGPVHWCHRSGRVLRASNADARAPTQRVFAVAIVFAYRRVA